MGQTTWLPVSFRYAFGAGVALAFCIAPVYARAADLGLVIGHVENANVSIHQGDTVRRSDVSSVDNFWRFYFSWPNAVSNHNARFFIIRGTFGNLADGAPQYGVNYVYNGDSWNAGSNTIGKSMGFPLGSVATPTGDYTIMIAETDDPGLDQTMQWFASGGASGITPTNYSFLTFTYSAANLVEQVPGAVASVQYADRVIHDGDAVYRKEVIPSFDNPSKFWRFNFDWPNAINGQNAFMIFRGTYGNVVGGTAVPGQNYGIAGSNYSSLNASGGFSDVPALEATSTAPSAYTVMLAEFQGSYNGQDPIQQTADWFASGGGAGGGPRRYSLLTFNFAKYAPCCSSVAFLPGIEGSVLQDGANTLWPPTLYDVEGDLDKLMQNPDGTPTHPGITTAGIISTFYGAPIYQGFIIFMDDLVASTTAHVHEWKPLPYDWRYSPEKIVADAGMVATIEQLAAHSENRHVTLVAHSMGGLVGKELIKKLVDKGEGDLIDSFVMVAAPQLGTPQAAAGLLHGEGSDITLGPFTFVNKAQVRALAQNMESAYHLLPSARYVDDVVIDPPVVFSATTTLTAAWRGQWGFALNTFPQFFDFLTGNGLNRVKPAPTDIHSPEVLNTALFQHADAFHTDFDTFTFPSSMRVVQVAGWGLPTIKGIEYVESHGALDYRPLMTTEGDKNVVYPSALSVSTPDSYFFNMFTYNKLNPAVEHRNVFSAFPVDQAISAIITGQPITDISFLSTTKPVVADLTARLLVSVHSPVTIGVHDSHGNFTGIAPGQDPASGVEFITEDIPGSQYLPFGEGKYLILPSDEPYTFVIEGTGNSTFTFEATELQGDTAGTSTIFAEIPVTPLTHATTTIPTDPSVASHLTVDENGDGATDIDLASVPDGVVIFSKTPLSISADNKAIVLGSALPPLTATLGPTPLNLSAITGAAGCSTTATGAAAGKYPINCIAGTLASYLYNFATFVPGTLSIAYRWDGFMQPINDTAHQIGQSLSVFKWGSTIPVKLQLKKADGSVAQSLAPPQWLVPQKGTAMSAAVDESLYSDPGTAGTAFKWDSVSQQYVYNWSTKTANPGYWYKIFVKLDDGTTQSVTIGLK